MAKSTSEAPKALGEGTAPGQQPDRLAHLHDQVPREQPLGPGVGHGSHRADLGGTALLAPRPVAQIPRRQGPQPFGSDGPAPFGVDLAGLAEAFGHRQQGRQPDLHVLPAVVDLERQAQPCSGHLELSHAAGEGQARQFGHLRPHLPGVPVDGIALRPRPGRTAPPDEGPRQRPGRGQGVGTGEHGVAEVDAPVGPPGNRLAEHVLGCRRSHGDDRAAAARGPGQLHGLGHGTSAVGVHLEPCGVALEASVVPEGERLGYGNLFDERRDAQPTVVEVVRSSGRLLGVHVPLPPKKLAI